MAKIVHADIGDRLIPQATFTVASTPTDPTQIIVKQQDPAGTETVITTASSPATLLTTDTPLARVSAGIFKLNPGVAAVAAGHYFFRFEGTGTAEAAEDFQYDVDPSEFYTPLSVRALVGMAETKDWLQVQNITTENDLELARVIDATSDRAHQEAGREFRATTSGPGVVRLFDVDALAVNRRQVLIGDLASAPTLVRILDKDGAAVVTVAAGDQILLPRIREAWEPVQRIKFTSDVTKLLDGHVVEVTGTWGFPSVPENVRQAVLDAVAATMDRDVEHYSQDLAPTAPSAGGNVLILGAGRSRPLSMPPVSLATLWGYRSQVYA